MDTPWLDRVRALLDPVQFDRDPRDGLDRVFLQTFRAGTSPETAAAWRDDIRAALACDTPLPSLLPLAHADPQVRAFLEAVAQRLEARFPSPAPPAAPSPPTVHPALSLLLATCDAIESGDVDAEDRLADLEVALVDAIGELEASELDEGLSRRDLELQALGRMLEACLDLGSGGEVTRARHEAAEAELVLLRAATFG